MKFKLVSVLVFFVSLDLSSNNARTLPTCKSDTVKKTKGWEPGYVVTKTTHDTILGFIDLETSRLNMVQNSWYRKNAEDRKSQCYISPDSFLRFGIGNRHFKYMNYRDTASSRKKRNQYFIKGWVEIFVEGSIVLSQGVCEAGYTYVPGPGMGGSMRLLLEPCFCLRKGEMPTVILVHTSTGFRFTLRDFVLSEVSDKNKERFLNMLPDCPELLDEWKQKKMIYNDIFKIVKVYNSKNNSQK